MSEHEPDPSRKDLERILRDGVREIEQLRRQNEILSAQVRVIDVFDRAIPRQGGGCMSEDVAWTMQRLAIHYAKEPPKKSEADKRES